MVEFAVSKWCFEILIKVQRQDMLDFALFLNVEIRKLVVLDLFDLSRSLIGIGQVIGAQIRQIKIEAGGWRETCEFVSLNFRGHTEAVMLIRRGA